MVKRARPASSPRRRPNKPACRRNLAADSERAVASRQAPPRLARAASSAGMKGAVPIWPIHAPCGPPHPPRLRSVGPTRSRWRGARGHWQQSAGAHGRGPRSAAPAGRRAQGWIRRARARERYDPSTTMRGWVTKDVPSFCLCIACRTRLSGINLHLSTILGEHGTYFVLGHHRVCAGPERGALWAPFRDCSDVVSKPPRRLQRDRLISFLSTFDPLLTRMSCPAGGASSPWHQDRALAGPGRVQHGQCGKVRRSLLPRHRLRRKEGALLPSLL